MSVAYYGYNGRTWATSAPGPVERVSLVHPLVAGAAGAPIYGYLYDAPAGTYGFEYDGGRFYDRASDEALAGLVARGDRVAFDHLVRRFGGRAIGVALAFLGHFEDAEDAVQQAWERVWRLMGSFAHEGTFRGL